MTPRVHARDTRQHEPETVAKKVDWVFTAHIKYAAKQHLTSVAPLVGSGA